MAQRVAGGAAAGRLNRRFLLVAILLAGLSAALVYAKISAGGGGSGSGKAVAGDTAVVVARVPIKQRTLITGSMIEVKNVPANAVAAGALTNVEDVVNKVTKFPIEVNQQIVTTAVVDTSKPTAGDALAPVVPDGKRAFSISASQVLTAGGLLLPGDYVDVVWVCCEKGIEWQGASGGKTFSTSAIVLSRPVVQNVQVAAVAQSIVPSGPVGSAGGAGAGGGTGASGDPVAANTPKQIPDATTITLLVTPDQANILLMAEATGTLRAALRNPGDAALIPAGNEIQFVTPGLIPPDVMRLLQDTFTQR